MQDRMQDKAYLIFPKISMSEITLLWHENYWDGYLSGKCLYRGRMHHFECVDQGQIVLCENDPDEIDETKSDNWYRRFSLIPMSDEEIAECTYRHNLFRQHVGNHCDYDPVSRQRNIDAGTRPSGEYHKFYDVAKTWPDLKLKEHTPIGWFEDLR